MKFVIALILLAAGVAQAQTTALAFTFVPASDYLCVSYCTGYFTSDPAYRVDYVNLQNAGAPGYKINISVNGKAYQGIVSPIFDGGTLYSTVDGTSVTLTDINYTYKHTCVRSGRGQHCTSWYFVTDGRVTQP